MPKLHKHIRQLFTIRQLDYWLIGLVLTLSYFTSSPIWSPDSSSYFGIVIHRFPVYTIWLRVWELIFEDSYLHIVVVLQLLLGLVTIPLVARRIVSVFKLHKFIHGVLLIVLVYPYFAPLWVAHNITSEGLAYPLYLMVVYYSITFLYIKKQRVLFHLMGSLILLCLTRGQFIIMPLIIAVIYFLQQPKKITQKTQIICLATLLLTPFAIKLLDRSYHKIVHDNFVPTPYSFVNIVTLPLFVSDISDSTSIADPDVRQLFIASHNTIDSLNLLSQSIQGSAKNKYEVFHNNFPEICNKNIHKKARNLYLKKGYEPWNNFIKAEEACKILTPILIKNNLNEYLTIYWEGILRGFKSIFIFAGLLLLAILGLFKFLRKPTKENSMIVLCGALIFSNALIVGIACHSIDRYLFYNYALALVMIVLFLRKLQTYYAR